MRPCVASGLSTLGPRHVHDLPAEVITEAFWFLSFIQVLHAAQVCQRWRDLGIDHPIFWRYITVTSITRGSLEMLRARLGQTDDRPFTLHVDVPGADRLIETKLMELINISLYNVRDLTIHLDGIFFYQLLAVLRNHAPKLQRFHIKLYAPDRWMAQLPITPLIFDSMPGQLEYLRIEDVIFPDSPNIPAFANVRTLVLCMPPDAFTDFPTFLFEYCPLLEVLSITIGTMTLHAPLPPAATAGLARLDHLDVHLSPSSVVDFVAKVPLATIRAVALGGFVDFDTVYDFLEPLRSPFNFTILRNGHDVWTTVESRATRYTRSFVQHTSVYKHYSGDPASNPKANALYDNEDFPAQVEMLTVSLSLWDTMMPYLHNYKIVTVLTLHLDICGDEDHPYRLPRSIYAFPCLSALGFCTRPSLDEVGLVHVHPRDLVDFAGRIAVTGPQCIDLYLPTVGMAVVDRSGLLEQEFHSVTFIEWRGRGY
ncbi:hypothetical protein EXIGLDRAFT_732968 [Exidia glandulosa HHB12029]|uniref:F-box domain-containing protein n=1 Tax=Exidia glandulosa HHB12029 TaxID=1314781 RepID=A0A166AZI2_EXIGL|nr:hypothetical protein EXIGLDRAFT_732968 [Exidia glandulosa HHB12029]